MRIKGRTTAVLGTILLVLMALVFAPTSFASCSTGVEENEDVVVEPTAISTPTPTSTPTQIPEPTQTPTTISPPRPRTISTVLDSVEAGHNLVVVGGASEYIVGGEFTLNFGGATEEDIRVVAIQFERRPNRGVHLLFLQSALTYAHTSGESVSEIQVVNQQPTATPHPYQVPSLDAPISRTPSVPQIPANVIFRFDPSTSQADQDAIRLGVELSSQLYRTLWNQLAGPVTIMTTTEKCNKDVVVFGWIGNRTICGNIAGTQWTGRTFEQKLKGMAHEYFHNLQLSIGCQPNWDAGGRDEPIWLGEGAAEFYAYWSQSESGYGALHKSLKELKTPLTLYNALTLSQMESPIASRPETFNLALATVAVDYLVSRTNLRAYVDYCELRSSGVQWRGAFQTAFGLTTSEFYEQFELYRANGYK